MLFQQLDIHMAQRIIFIFEDWEVNSVISMAFVYFFCTLDFVSVITGSAWRFPSARVV